MGLTLGDQVVRVPLNFPKRSAQKTMLEYMLLNNPARDWIVALACAAAVYFGAGQLSPERIEVFLSAVNFSLNFLLGQLL